MSSLLEFLGLDDAGDSHADRGVLDAKNKDLTPLTPRAGFSSLASDRQGRGLPAGNQLAAEILTRFGREDLRGLSLAQIYTVISTSQRELLNEYLTERFTVAQFDPRYRCLERLQLANWFTTNIDNLAHEVLKGSRRYYLNDVATCGPAWKDRRAVDYFALHGCVLNPARPYRFGVLEVASSFGADPDRWWYLLSQLQRHPTLFWGYSFRDAATLEALYKAGDSASRLEAWILVVPEDNWEAKVQYFRSLGLQIIVGSTEQMLDYLAQLLPERSAVDEETVTVPPPDVLPRELIPDPGDVAARPVEHFFRGAPPTWSDVYSGLVPQLSPMRAVENEIAARMNVIITGVPACGKTTLLMQLAAKVRHDMDKFFLDGPRKDQAELFCRQLRGRRALVFVDNATDDAEALHVLARSAGLQFVAADRSYYLSVVSHLLPLDRCTVLDITGLDDADLQRVRDAIPKAIRTDRLQLPPTSAGMRPSLFEFVEANVTEPSLADRFKTAMRDLALSNPMLAEMLLLVSYVHSCRTPLSMDMALAYWRGRIVDFRRVYALVQQAGRLVSEYYGQLADEPQDYYVARSVLAADAIVAAASREVFREMLMRFHRNLSPSRICHYNVFQRRAYDAGRVAARAFVDWQEGREFYETVYRKTLNPYVLQQEALYLSNKNKDTEAFQAVERALAEGGSANWTILNTYAIILFRRNIKFADDRLARPALQESMDLLARCYASDRRKGFHAKTFADQAIQFWEAYHDVTAAKYIRLAHTWLGEAGEKEPWDRGIPRLRRTVDNLLRDLRP